VGQASNATGITLLKTLYRGILPPVLTAGAVQSMNFGLYETFKDKLRYQYTPALPFLHVVFLAGAGSGAIMSTITTPISMVKIQQQINSQKGIIATSSDLYRSYGIRGFYRGFGVFSFMETFGRGVYLWTYEASKEALQPFVVQPNGSTSASTEGNGSSIYSMFRISEMQLKMISAATAGMFSWFVVYPFDVVKARLQVDISGTQYHNTVDCCIKIYKQCGPRGFIRGLGFTVMRAAPVASTILPIYESIKEYMERVLSVQQEPLS
jgi:Mitochondrial carrier protein